MLSGQVLNMLAAGSRLPTTLRVVLLDSPSVLTNWSGQTEAALRDVASQSRAAGPAGLQPVVDQIDDLAGDAQMAAVLDVAAPLPGAWCPAPAAAPCEAVEKLRYLAVWRPRQIRQSRVLPRA